MDYEKAWKNLKVYTGILSWASLRFAESEDMSNDERLQAEGGKDMGRTILNFMDELEKEMTTVRDDDGQSAQD